MDSLSDPFTWWDDALELARVRAIFTGRRQAVRAWLGGWIVEEAAS